MKKMACAWALLLIFLLGIPQRSFASIPTNKVVLYIGSGKAYVNNEKVMIDPQDPRICPIVQKDRTLVPVKFVSESLGAKVDWENETATVSIVYHDDIVKLPIGKNEMDLNGEKIALEVPAQVLQYRTYVPLAAISQALKQKIFYYQGLMILSSEDMDIGQEDWPWVLQMLEEYDQDTLKIPILIYHHFQENVPRNMQDTTVAPKEFEEHLQTLKNNGYTSISSKQLYDFIKNGKALPPKPYVLTMDDGYESNYIYAFPLLKKYNTKAIISIVTSTVGKTPGNFPHFTWEQAKEMEQSGLVEIQNHSLDHRNQTLLTEQRLMEETSLAQSHIEGYLGKREVKVFTYPGGQYTDKTREVLSRIGFEMQFTGVNSLVSKDSDLTHLKRINIRGGKSGNQILEMIEKLKK